MTSGRIRGISLPSDVSSPGKRKRKSVGDVVSKQQRDQSPTESVWVPRREYPAKRNKIPKSSYPGQQGGSIHEPTSVRAPSSQGLADSHKTLPPGENSPTYPNIGLEGHTAVMPPDEPATIDLELPPFIPWPLDHLVQPDMDAPDDSLRQPTGQPSTELPSSNSPAVRATGPGLPQPQVPAQVQAQAQPRTQTQGSCETKPQIQKKEPEKPQTQAKPQTEAQPKPQPPSLVAPNITPPPTPHDIPLPKQSKAASTNEADRLSPTLTTFLAKAGPAPLGPLATGLQKVGISTVAELRVIARKPEAFRTKIPALADLRVPEEYLWFMFRKALKKLPEEDRREQSTDNPAPESDPVKKFVQSLGGEEWIDSGAFANGLLEAGISSEKDLLVLSRDLEKYTENIPFLREFATTKKFGWVIFQVGLEGLGGRKTSASVRAQDYGADREGTTYIKRFLDTIDSDKPLGHLTNDFIRAGLTSHIRLLNVAEDIKLALDSMPFVWPRGIS